MSQTWCYRSAIHVTLLHEFEQFWPSFQTAFKQIMNINEAFMTSYWSFNFLKGKLVKFDMSWGTFRPTCSFLGRARPVGLGVWFLVRSFVFFRALCVRAAGALVGLGGCAGSPGPSLVAYVRCHGLMSWLSGVYLRFHAFTCNVTQFNFVTA